MMMSWWRERLHIVRSRIFIYISSFDAEQKKKTANKWMYMRNWEAKVMLDRYRQAETDTILQMDDFCLSFCREYSEYVRFFSVSCQPWCGVTSNSSRKKPWRCICIFVECRVTYIWKNERKKNRVHIKVAENEILYCVTRHQQMLNMIS